MQKKTIARHVAIWMVFFLTKCLIRFHDLQTRSRQMIFIAIWDNKILSSHVDGENSLLGEIMVPPCFPPRAVFSTPRVFHQTPCFPRPVFSTPGFHPENPTSRFPTSQNKISKVKRGVVLESLSHVLQISYIALLNNP